MRRRIGRRSIAVGNIAAYERITGSAAPNCITLCTAACKSVALRAAACNYVAFRTAYGISEHIAVPRSNEYTVERSNHKRCATNANANADSNANRQPDRGRSETFSDVGVR